MALYFKSVTYNDPPSGTVTVSLPEALNTASVALQGFKVSFGPNTSTYVDDVEVQIRNITANRGDSEVSFNLEYQITTNSGEGNVGNNITVLVIADLQGSTLYAHEHEVVG